MAENFQKTNSRFKKLSKPQTRSTQRYPWQDRVKLLKTQDKEKNLQRDQQHLTYRQKAIWTTKDFSSETMEAKKKWHNIFRVPKEISAWNFLSSENILQKWRGRHSQRKTWENLSLADLPKRMAKGNSFNKKKMIDGRNLETSGQKNNGKSKTYA